MKDYSLYDERNTYILSYRVENIPGPSQKQKIICKMADGKEQEYIWSREMEYKILDKMRDQIEKASFKGGDYLSFSVIGVFEIIASNFISSSDSTASALLKLFGSWTVLKAFLLISFDRYKQLDFDKLDFYRKNKDVINKAINGGMVLPSNIGKRTASKIKADLEVKIIDPLNPNGLDKYKLRDLKLLKDMAELYNETHQEPGQNKQNNQNEKTYAYPV